MGGMDWIDVAQDRYRLRVLISAVMNFRVPQMSRVSRLASQYKKSAPRSEQRSK
jgi:hypothetical protein